MFAVSSIAGNIFANRRIAERYRRSKADGVLERLFVSRMELERLRLRRTTDKGTDVGLVLEPGSKLHHGDILAGEKFIVVEQLPEKVITVSLKKGSAGQIIGLAALIGHSIGNRHRPIAVNRGTISFPIQAESELDVFKKVLPAGVKMKLTEQIFLPSGDAHAHE